MDIMNFPSLAIGHPIQSAIIPLNNSCQSLKFPLSSARTIATTI
jgi:hypothetical protein